jgi:transposase
MTDFEDQLRGALERKQPSSGFAARVVASAARRPKPAFWTRWQALGAAGIAASLFVGALSLDLDRRQRQQGEAARAQLIQAMQITSSQLQRIQKKVQGTLR